ncbi:serine/threonine-protein kinase PLK3-like isoform X2 [Brienomyrus brachyistius]|uniref:serine/threonine-protein kinase PLK3-like isoform X2 n=1 Tax=Brienomyrus brachyistius TaxID=42636 RepID=UPI0020B42C78|nr:serine/threonine-protein kinase PLK3-like isoform X2 [Brienomyrus brachyistius]
MGSQIGTLRRPVVPKILNDPRTSKWYSREERLGEGAFGQCFKMTDMDSGETYAVKVIPLKYGQKQWACKEAEILKKMQHKHVVGISHSFEDETNMYIFMELCRKETLMSIKNARGTLTTPEVRYYMRQLILGLKYIHEQGYVHRDIKLANLFINENMEIKIGDFGLATKQDPRDIQLCGTFNYIAPEVWRRQGHGPESDVWAMGCVMYQLLVGELPFDFSDISKLVASIWGLLFTLPRKVPKSARRLLKKIFQVNPQDRPTLDQILQDKFFTEGFTPEELPASSCYSVPQLEEIHHIQPVSRVRRFFRRLTQCFIQRNRSRVESPYVEPSIRQVERRPLIIPLKEEPAKSPC